jgi:biotin carboxyl carrier protein
MKLATIKILFSFIYLFALQNAYAQDVKGIEVDFSKRLTAPQDLQCVQISSQPRDGTSPHAQAREQFIFSLKEKEPIIAPAPGVVVRDNERQFVIFHGRDALGNNVLSVLANAMDKLLVKKGQFVKRGEPLGEVNRGATGYFSAMVSNNTDAQPFLDSIFQLARATNVPASYFLYPVQITAGKSEVSTFAKIEAGKDYGDADWEKTKKFTGFTYPFACTSVK